jgi:hypothetical protein
MCRLQSIVNEAQEALLGVLDKYKLSDVAGPESLGLRKRLGVAVEA